MSNTYQDITLEQTDPKLCILDQFNVRLDSIYNYLVLTSTNQLEAGLNDHGTRYYGSPSYLEGDNNTIAIQIGSAIYGDGKFVDATKDIYTAFIMLRIGMKHPETLVTINLNLSPQTAERCFDNGCIGLFIRQNFTLPVNILDIVSKKTNNSDPNLLNAITGIEGADNSEALNNAIDNYIDACFKLQRAESLAH